MNTQKQPSPRAKVLILVHSDKFIEAFSSDRNVDIHFHHAPEAATSDKAEILSERLIEVSLPTFWSRIFTQGYRIGLFAIRKKTVLDELTRSVGIAFCRGLDEASSSGKDAA